MFTIKVNGIPQESHEGTTLLELIQKLGVEGKVMACALNMEIVKKEQWATQEIRANDSIELLEFVGGG